MLKDGKTFSQVLTEIGIRSINEITTDRLDVAANSSMFHRFVREKFIFFEPTFADVVSPAFDT